MKEFLDQLIAQYDADKLASFFEAKSSLFTRSMATLPDIHGQLITQTRKIGEINFKAWEKLVIIESFVGRELDERSSKRIQYEFAKTLLKKYDFGAGIFVFFDSSGNFRFSLIYPEAVGTRRQWSNFRRFTYFVSRQFTNKTFLERMSSSNFSSFSSVKDAFAVGPVTEIFYKDFFNIYNKLVKVAAVKNSITEEKARDFVLLFSIRTIFLGFIQKRNWLGDDQNFIQKLFSSYLKSKVENRFYEDWLSLLFFEALNNKFFPRQHLPAEINSALQLAPYLNGGLFREKDGYDGNGWYIPDQEIGEFFDFLFSHSFTIEESSIDDSDLQLNPEFLGIIFERIVNKADGAVYTPRTEVDYMCRLSLVKWLQKNQTSNIRSENLYELFFRESEKDNEQKVGSFSKVEAIETLDLLENLAICDPAVGSGAFLVGMMQVLDEVENNLRERFDLVRRDSFDRKKQIIGNSLYGVEVKEWAVWICQLRLWLSLFIEAPEELRMSQKPILPSLDFKVRQGDSLVQRVGSKLFPVIGYNQALTSSLKKKITELKTFKIDFFNNKTIFANYDVPRQKELRIYEEILSNEIQEKQNELKSLKGQKTLRVTSLFGGDEVPQQTSLELNKEKIDQLENEILELSEQKSVLRKDKPLVWCIEFAEVFTEKGGFDIIIGNPPYVRQEDIADPTGRIKDKKEYKGLLAEMVKLDFPNDFSQKTKINGQSDLYTYFYIRGLRLLNPQGIHTFICSNSWLDVGYGVWLQKFLLERAPVELIIDNHAKRSFEAADVNTIISVIHAPLADRKRSVSDDHVVKFIAFKKPFEEVIYTENLLAIEKAQEITSNEMFRVYPITNDKLEESGIEFEDETQEKLKVGKYIGEKWGSKFLRAPDILFTILNKGKDKLVKLSDVAVVRRGFTTGVNEFFYINEEQSRRWGIENEFLKPVIKSPRECKSIVIDAKKLSFKLFICNKRKEALAGTKALEYIEWGERQKTKDGVFWKDVPSVSGRRDWYSLGDRVPAKINFNYLISEVGTSYVGECFVSDNFQEIHTEKHIELFLNSSVSYLLQLNTGRVGFGGGLLKIQTYEVKRLQVMELNIVGLELLKKDKESIFLECGIDPQLKIPIEEQEPCPLPDRAKLDKVVFDALELTSEERKDVYRAVCRLVWNRVSKASSA
ncbi:MAG: DNA methyltransferase [Candidatus Berkelbacteria bacterium]